MSRNVVRRLFEIGVAILVIGTFAGAALGQPVFLSYVETDSMSPTIEPGDGFVAVPTAVSGDIDRGDVVVFDAEYIHDGGLVTHRVIDQTEEGYITRGDANPFPDQSGGEPPVARDRVVATALQINGNVVVLPGFGDVTEATNGMIETMQRHVAATTGLSLFRGSEGLALLLGLVFLLYGALGTDDSRTRERDRSRQTSPDTRLLVAGFVVVLLLSTAIGTAVTSDTRTYDVRTNQTEHATYTLTNGVIPTTVFLRPESEGIDTDTSVAHLMWGETHNVSVAITPGSDGVGAQRQMSEYRYPTVLPPSTLRWLHGVHPWLAVLGVNFVLGVSFYLVGSKLFGTGTRRDYSRRKQASTITRVRRALEGRR